jgi:release factor glutamine methyltransferase
MTITIADALRHGRARLAARVAEPAREAELLLSEVLGCPRAALVARAEAPVAEEAFARYESLLERRALGEPVAYLLGRRDFWSLELEVGPGVLVPRHETELLVELTLAELTDVRAPRVLDLGTGSGAIGLALAHARPDAHVDLVDASEAALAVAERNRARLGIGNATLRPGDWYAAVGGDRYRAIVANPPYLATDDPHLAGAELGHEPRGALVAGPTGLEDLERIARGAPAHLVAGGWLACEHGATQGDAVRRLYAAAGFGGIGTARDLAGLERVTFGRHAGSAPG